MYPGMTRITDLRMYQLGTTEVSLDALADYRSSLQAHIFHVKQAADKILGMIPELVANHDESKWGMDEFPYYARQFHGDKGDPDGFARAWLHHIHHNPHHWQHWIFPDGFTPKGSSVENGVVEMPYRYTVEMVADWLGASMAYTNSWDMTDWLVANMERITLHSRTAAFVRDILDYPLGLGDVAKLYTFATEKAPGVPREV